MSDGDTKHIYRSASMKGPFADQGIEGPGYADRIKGRLTFRDWDHWAEEDREEYRAEFIAHHCPWLIHG
jgi:hypothetical protein